MGRDPSRPLPRRTGGLLPDAGDPALGRLCEDIRPGLRRFEHGKHVLFYRQESRGILLSRILHQRMLPERHVMDSEEEES
jgi:plasmid stabilization system protein ParE